MMNDIDLSETAPRGDWYSGNGWKPIAGAGEDEFTGVFDGNGYAIKNMHIYGELDSSENKIGLFGKCQSATIEHLALADCDIDVTTGNSSGNYVGSIVGYLNNQSSILECYTTGTIKIVFLSGSYGSYTGGIIGYANYGNIENCFNACNISSTLKDENGRFYFGGIAGNFVNGQSFLNYSVGDIITTDESSAESKIGYIANNALNDYDLKSCFYLKKNTDYTASANHSDNYYTNVIGLTAGQMKSSAAFTGFDFDNIWTIDPNADYPYPTLRNVPYVSTGASQPQTPSPDTSLKGDINGDGKVDATDASIILIYAAMVGAGYQVSIDDLY
ncbi:MAG: hypothetical protein V3G42_11935 [Oscillospiraceae bacterium]